MILWKFDFSANIGYGLYYFMDIEWYHSFLIKVLLNLYWIKVYWISSIQLLKPVLFPDPRLLNAFTTNCNKKNCEVWNTLHDWGLVYLFSSNIFFHQIFIFTGFVSIWFAPFWINACLTIIFNSHYIFIPLWANLLFSSQKVLRLTLELIWKVSNFEWIYLKLKIFHWLDNPSMLFVI